jgi:hypothetical protein
VLGGGLPLFTEIPERASEPVGDSFMPFSNLCSDAESSYTGSLKSTSERRRRDMQDPYNDSYGIRETEVAIEEFVNRLLELYPDLDPLRVSELIYEQVQNIVIAAGSGEQY